MNTVVLQHDELKNYCIAKLVAVGVSEEHATIVADVLVHANLRGVDSHGVMRMEHYIKRINSGGINPQPSVRHRMTGAATALVDGDDGLGHVVAKKAMALAVEIARESGVGMVGVINSSHCGALSYYVNQAADHNMVGLAMSNTDKAVVPFGGKKPFFGTNPLAFGFPARNKKHVILDMATSVVAYGKVLHAKENGKSIPADWAVDAEGRSITDPAKYFALMPFGGPKGFGLALVVDIFAGILTGSAFGPHVSLMYGDYGQKRKLGQFFCAVNIESFTETEMFLDSMDSLIEELHAVPAAEGFSQVLVPGEPESMLEKQRLEQGIPINEAEYKFLTNDQ